MFIGHFAVGLAAKRWAPGTSLAVLTAAAVLADILWPVFLLAGIERVRIVPGWTPMNALDLEHYPWSHSLLLLLAWGALFGWLVSRFSGNRTAGIVVFAGVVSHWLLDWITHRPDMPLWPGSFETGLYLWRSVAATMVVEIAMWVVGAGMWLRATRARNRKGSVGAWVYLILLLALYVADRWSPVPPGAEAIAAGALISMAVMLGYIRWFDRHREPA